MAFCSGPPWRTRASNPLPSPDRDQCRCSPQQVERYRERISGPLRDRIDIHLEVAAVQYREIATQAPGESSELIRGRVARVRALRLERFRGLGAVRPRYRTFDRKLWIYIYKP